MGKGPRTEAVLSIFLWLLVLVLAWRVIIKVLLRLWFLFT